VPAIAFGYITLQAWVLSVQSIRLMWQGPGAFEPPFGPKYALEWGWVLGHGISACLLICLGPLLLARRQFPLGPGWHARLGKVYLLSAAVAIVTGLPLASRAEGGWLATLSFYTLSAWWSLASWQVYRTARSRQWGQHQRWVRFHYTLAFSAVFLRIGLGLAAYLDLEVHQVAAGLAWASWQPAMLYAWRAGLLSKRKQPAVMEPAV